MDREILFRAKFGDEWKYGYLSVEPKGLVIKEPYEHNQSNIWHIDPSTVGQYTGLTDKNGKKIFEGDIVNFRTGYYQFKNLIISFDEQTARFVCKNKKCGKMPLDNKWNYEVIGNIYDNPELLEVSK